MNWIKGGILLFCIGVFFSCSTDDSRQDENEQEWDTEFLPEGTERTTYAPNIPNAENFGTSRIDPPYWWTEMENDTLELLIYDREINNYGVTLRREGVDVLSTTRVENPNYLFVKLLITDQARPGRFPIQLTQDEQPVRTYIYELKPRISIPGRIDPLNQSDIMYLIMPDRFANGDTTNDSYDDMLQTGTDRSRMYFRHGGDIQGIADHIDHLLDLGITAVWSTPLLENDQPYSSYHGYAVTDHYTIDKRFGTNDEYVRLSSQLQANGIKLVKDLVFNHVGHMHWFIRDIPSVNWIHQGPTYIGTNHTAPSVKDPYASTYDKSRMIAGWFDYTMPDLNHGNPLLANYLIQNAIWWIEYAGIDAYRLDTYHFCEHEFMKEMGRRVLEEYPDFYFFGETWVYSDPLQASFVANSATSDPDVVMPAVADFQLNFALRNAFTDPVEVHKGVYDIYYTLANDFLYENASRNVTFLDNHDMDRIFATVNENPTALKSALTMLLTMRGIPCIYYGTEFAFTHKADPDGKVRPDMPGGWPGDEVNLFNPDERDSLQKAIYKHVKTLISLRKESEALRTGKTTQFAPQGNDGVYSYFRNIDDRDIYFVLFNSTDQERVVDNMRYFEMLGNNSSGEDPLTSTLVTFFDGIKIKPHTTLMLRPVSR